LFSKKKKIDLADVILVDEIYPHNGNREQRDTFRYIFTPEKRLSMQFMGRTLEILDISAGGLAFANHGFKQYEADKISLALEMPNYNENPVFTAQTRILHITANNICHCIFENCAVEEYEIIHKYVLEMQKQDLNPR